MSKFVKKLLSDAKIDGYFMNHLLRRTAPTRLFQAGIERKIFKEITGHRSDAIECYQVTSEDQQRNVSKIISGGNVPKKVEKLEESKTEEQKC